MLRRELSQLLAFAVFVTIVLAASPSVAQGTSWWQPSWNYQLPLAVKNNSSSTAAPARYSVRAIVNTSALVSAQQMLPDCSDLRVVYFDGTTNTELDRVVNACNSSQTEVWFALQAPIAPGATGTAYFMYYGNSVAGAPPNNGMNVFVFYEDWENGSAHWINAGGLDPSASGTMGTTQLSTDSAVSGVNSEKFTVKAYGGDAFTGFIPVTPSTRYAVSVWGMSGAASYVPVGFDPYDANKSKSNEVWFWTSQWTLGSQWTQRTANFTTSSTTSFLKLKNEWWGNSIGNLPVYLDNIVLRLYMTSEPTITFGNVVTGLPSPTVTAVSATSPISLGTSTTVTATANSNGGASVTQLVLQILSPETASINMSLVSGDGSQGTWQAQFTPAKGGTYNYNVSAYSGNQSVAQSGTQTFSVVDTEPPTLALVSILDPLQANSVQTLVVEATDNGAIAGVNVTLNGSGYPMVRNGNRFSYSWRVTNAGAVPYQVVATDTGGNSTTLSGSFTVETQKVGVCTWLGCKQGAESFSIDDAVNSCRTELETAGFRGTYFVQGTAPQAWFSDYSAAGHEIASHSVSHQCVAPCCSPNCTAQTLASCPFTNTDVVNYQQSELEPNIAMIERSVSKPVLTMAWPCGCVDPAREKAARAYYLGGRGFFDSFANLTFVNTVNTAEPFDFFNLGVGLSVEYSGADFTPTPIDLAASQGGWTVIATHGDCTEVPYMGQRKDVLWAAPIGEVLKYIKVRDAAGFSNYNRSSQEISFDAVHNLPTFERQKLDGSYFLPVIYDNVVTLMTAIEQGDSVGYVRLDGVDVPYSFTTLNGTRYVTFDASLLNVRHVTIGLASDFALALDSTTQTITAGRSASFTISTTPYNGYSGTLELSVSGLPRDTAYSFSANVVTPPQTAILTLTTATDTPAGSYSLTVSASDGTLVHSSNAVLTVTSPLSLQSLTLAPTTVFGGASTNATITLSGAAPAGGTVVALSTNSTDVSVPSNVTVPSGASTASVSLSTTAVKSATPAVITAQLDNTSQNATLTIQPLLVQSVALTPTSVFGGASATGTVTLNGVAPTATVIGLTSNDPAATLPASVTVASGASSVTFGISTVAVNSLTSATVTADLNGATRSTTLAIQPLLIQSISLAPTSVIGGSAVTGTVTLNGAVPTAQTVGLSSNNAAASVPLNVTIPVGASSVTFLTSTTAVNSQSPATISAQLGASSQSAVLTIQPLIVQSVSVTPNTVQGGIGATGTVTLNGASPASGTVVAISSSSGAATVPSSVTVPPGAGAANFAITTTTVPALTSTTIAAQLGTSSQSATLAILPPPNSAWWQPQWLYRLPLTVKNNSTSTLASRYSVKLLVNTSALIGAQQLLTNCADLRVIYFDGTTYNVLDRVVNACNTTQTEIWFALQRSIAGSASDTAYYMYYGNSMAGAPPSNGMNVFLFYEDWENGPTHWTNAGGLDASASGTMGATQISTDSAVSGSNSEKFPVKAWGGDAFSGFIPVTPSTRYSVSVRGMSATSAYVPVGYDPYTSTKTKGNEVWFWTSAWTLSPQWTQRTANFTTSSTTSFLKLKSEWWGDGPGTAPVYLDDIVLRLYVTSEPTVTAGASQSVPN